MGKEHVAQPVQPVSLLNRRIAAQASRRVDEIEKGLSESLDGMEEYGKIHARNIEMRDAKINTLEIQG